MNTKKIVSFLLASIMVMSLLTGCGEKESDIKESSAVADEAEDIGEESVANKEEGTGITFPLEEPVTMTMLAVAGNEYTLEDSLTMKVMEELTNVHWEITTIPYDEQAEKKGVLLGTDDYPEVFFKGCVAEEDIESEAFIPLEDLIAEYAPNFTKAVEEADAWNNITSADGHIYALAQIEPLNIGYPLMFINEVWIENLGLKKPTNLDEFYDVLKAFKEQDADGDGDPNNEIPLIIPSDIITIGALAPYFGFNYDGWWSGWALDEASDEFIYWPATEEWKDALAYLNKLYEEELLYNECFNTTVEQYRALGLSGQAIGCFIDWSPTLTVGSSYNDENGKDAEYGWVDPFDSKYIGYAGIASGVFAITDACEYPEIAMAWVDYFYSEEGSRLAGLGVEGVTYEIREDGTWEWIKDGEYGEEPQKMATLWQGGAAQAPMLYSEFQNFNAYVNPDDEYAARSAETLRRIKENNLIHDPVPAVSLTEEESDSYSVIEADVSPYQQQYRAQVISGQIELENTWDDYLKKLEEMGLSEMVKIKNAAYDRLK